MRKFKYLGGGWTYWEWDQNEQKGYWRNDQGIVPSSLTISDILVVKDLLFQEITDPDLAMDEGL